MRARLALQVAGCACELREVVLRDKPAALLAVSPKGTVPVLVLPDGTVLEQSLDIMRWALAQHDPAGWRPTDADQQAAYDALVAHNDTVFKPALDRYKYPQRFGLDDLAPARDAGEAWLAVLDARLRQQPALAGARFGLADAALAPFVRQWAHTDPARFAALPCAALQAWLQAFEQSALIAAVMPKVATWVPGQPGVRFPFAPDAMPRAG